jgi:4-hydroxybenzoate polyprenyltransferase
VGTSTRAANPATGLAIVPALLQLVRFSHTIFALPFAFAGALLAELAFPGPVVLLWILVAMVGARTAAMALNRLIDARIDALNPRTASRELPTGRVTRRQVAALAVAGLVVLLVAVSQLPEITWYLWPIPVALFAIYPYAKRFTWTCHFILGITIGLAPIGAWIAVTGSFGTGGVLLGLAVATWIAGFDIIYALLDVEFDRANGLHSFPARFGPRSAMWVARGLHAATIALLLGAGAASHANGWYFAGVLACGGILVYEHVTADPANQQAIQRAFGSANMLMAVVFLTGVILAVATA